MGRLDDLLRAAEDLLRDIRDGVVSNVEARGQQLIQEMGEIRRNVLYKSQRLESATICVW